MADNMSLNFPMKPVFDVQQFNTILSMLKSSLGTFGKNIKLLDEATYKAEIAKLGSTIQTELPKAAQQATQKTTQAMQTGFAGMSGMVAKAFNFQAIAGSVQILSQAINQVAQPFIAFEASLADMSALTGVSGKALDAFGESAKVMASEFGGTATSQINAFKGILSRLGPDIAKSPEALERMTRAINTMSAASGLDATSSMDALTTSMLQFNVSLEDPVAASEVMTNMMNTLAAGAKEGAAEIPQVSEAIKVSGVAAYGAKISFEELNAGIQVMAAGGKTGAEAGTALRNVIGLIQKASGPGEAAMKKFGTSSKELGEILTTKGLAAAITKLRDGMNGIGSDAERNAAMIDIFGMENSAAAGILVKRVDQMEGLTAKITGTQTAFQQAKVNMDTTQSAIGRFKADVENMLISTFQKLGGGIAGMAQNIGTVLPLITALAGIKTIFPPGLSVGISKLGTTIITSLFPALAGTTLGLGSVAAAAWAALAPILPFVAIAAALGVGLYALAGGFNKSTESKIKDAEASTKLIDKQVEQQKANIKHAESINGLVAAWERLGKIQNKTPEELKTFNDLSLELTKNMPGAIDSNKSFVENLASVHDQLNKNNDKINEYKANIEKLQAQKEQTILVKVRLQADKAREDIAKTIGEEVAGLFTGGQRDDLVLLDLVKKMRFASNSQELAAARQELQEKIWNNGNIPPEVKVKLTEQADQVADAQGKIFEQKDKIQAEKKKQTINKMLDDIKAAQEKSQSGPIVNPQQAAKAVDAVKAIAAQYGFSKEEALKFLKEQEKNTAEAKRTAEAAAGIAVNYSESLKKANEEISAGEEKENNLKLKIQDQTLRTVGETTESLKKQLAEQQKLNRESDKKRDNLVKIGEGTRKEYEEGKKQSKNLFEEEKKRYEIQKTKNEIVTKQFENSTNQLALDQKRNLTEKESLSINQQKTVELEKDLAFLMKSFGIIEGADGKISINPAFSKNEADIEKMFVDLQSSIISSKRATLKVKPKIEVEQSDILKDLIETTKLEIELGFAVPGGVLPLMENFVTALQDEKAKLEKKLQEETDEAERDKINENLRKKNKEILEAEKQIRDTKRAEYEKQLKDLADKNAKELTEIQKSLDAKKALQDKLTEVAEKSAGIKESDKFNDDMKQLDKMKSEQLVSEDFYNKQKERLEKEHSARMMALQAAANGGRLAAERNYSLDLLNEQKTRAAQELAAAQTTGDPKLIAEKQKAFDDIVKQVQEKGTVFTQLSEQLEGGLVNSLTSLMSGDTEGMKDAARSTFGVMAGILKKEASLAITKLIINYLWDPSNPLPWYAKILAIPLITATISGAINALVDPILGSLTSFSTGGRIDTPTLVMAGDASRSRPGADTEWIFRDDQIATLISEALYRSRMTDITISELYRKNNESFILDAFTGFQNEIKAMVSITTPDFVIPEGYNPDMSDMTLNNPAISNIVNEAANLSTAGIESRLDLLLDKFDEFEGRIHIVESEVGIAANRYNNQQKKRSIV